MNSLWIPAVFVAVLTAGSVFAVAVITASPVFAQLPEVQPQPAPKGTVAQSVDDATITSKVTDAIASDPVLKGMEFTVATTDAVVTINGTAVASDQIVRAVALARSVAGVKSVTNILAVKTS